MELALEEANDQGLTVLLESGSLTQAFVAHGTALGASVEMIVDPDTGAQVLSFTIKRSDIPGASEDQAAEK